MHSMWLTTEHLVQGVQFYLCVVTHQLLIIPIIHTNTCTTEWGISHQPDSPQNYSHLSWSVWLFMLPVKTFLPDFIISPWWLSQTFMTTVFLDSGMWSTDAFWKLPGQSDMRPMAEQSRADVGQRGQPSSPRVSKCAPRRVWKRSSAATGPITNSEVRWNSEHGVNAFFKH